MVFSSLIFIYVFLPIFLILYFAFKNRKMRNIILLGASLFFYAYGEPIYSLLMIFSIIVNYFFALLIEKTNKKGIFIASVCFNLLLLGIFKYFNFFLDNLNNLFNLNIKFINLALPIGISFYTFQILTYIIDVYKKEVPAQKSIINLGCYIASFPQLIAGPIVRYQTVNEELNDRKENTKDFAEGLRRFILGLGKKVLIANKVAFICDHLLTLGPSNYGFIGALLIMISYTLQIYFDFSGYSDMAIGLGKMLGFHYLENFDYPYISKSITEFWRRWHISLSSFFKDYVYIPLGGNRVSILKNIRNIFIVWLLTGLWHGASWNFVIWGIYYGIILLLEKFVLKDWLKKMPSFLQHIYTMVLVMFGWVIFMSTDLTMIKDMMESIFFKNGLGNVSFIAKTQVLTLRYLIPLILGIILSAPIYKIVDKKLIKKPVLKDTVLIIIFLLSTLLILVDSYNPFIYFRF